MPEIEITNFLGQTEKTIAAKNQCRLMENWDIRDKDGAMISRDGYRLKYSAPSETTLTGGEFLRAHNFYAKDIDQEFTLVIQKATLNALAGTGISTTKDILAFWIRPYWDVVKSGSITGSPTTTVLATDITTPDAEAYVGSYLRLTSSSSVPSSRNSGNFRKIIAHTSGSNATFTIESLPYTPNSADDIEVWSTVDDWQWLNKMILTKITDVDVTDANLIQVDLGLGDSNLLTNWVIYNLTQDEYMSILADSDVSIATEILHSFYNTTNAINDEVILMKNYFPFEYLEQMYYVNAEEISFHNVLGDLRIGFGAKADRLGISVGFRNNSLQVGSLPPSAPSPAYLRNVAVISGLNNIILDPYNAETISSAFNFTTTHPASGGSSFDNLTYFYYITVLLDGISEFVIAEGNETPNTNDDINFSLKFFYGLFNKRITQIRVYLSEGDSASATEATNPYFLVKKIDVSNFDIDYDEEYWDFDDDGYVESSESILLHKDDFTNNLGEMESLIGYFPTLNYAKSWSSAITSMQSGKAFIANSYFDSRKNNQIYFSPIAAGAKSQFDVFVLTKYYNIESFSGDDLIGIALLSNLNLLVLTKLTTQILDTNYGNARVLDNKKGCVARRSIANIGNLVGWIGEEAVYACDGLRVFNLREPDLSKSGFKSVFNSKIFATADKNNCYRYFDGYAIEYTYWPEKRSWLRADRYLTPEEYLINEDGFVWFMVDGYIFEPYLYGDVDKSDSSQTVTRTWRSVLFNSKILGEGFTEFMRGYINSIGIKCSYNTGSILLKVYIDGSLYQTLTLSTSVLEKNFRLHYGASFREFYLEIASTSSNKQQVDALVIDYDLIESSFGR